MKKKQVIEHETNQGLKIKRNQFSHQSGELLLEVFDQLGKGDEFLDLDHRLDLVDVGHFDLALAGGSSGLQHPQELLLFFLDGCPWKFWR